MAIIKKTRDKYYEDVERKEPLYNVGGNVNFSPIMENNIKFPQNICKRTTL